MQIRTLILSLSFASILSCSTSKKAVEDNSQMTNEPTVKTEQLITGYEVIWGMDFLPNGDLLFSEKKGKLHRKSGDKITEITGLPTINTSGQGGLLDVRVSPQFNSNGWVYISYAGNHPGGGGSFNLMRFKLVNDQITEPKILLTSNSANTMTGHYGSRIDFDEAGNLFVSVGEGGATSYGGANSPNKNAQDVNSTWGKVHRITQDGSIPAGNPCINRQFSAHNRFQLWTPQPTRLGV
jgi:glucose/arabinose dehydrogenase